MPTLGPPRPPTLDASSFAPGSLPRAPTPERESALPSLELDGRRVRYVDAGAGARVVLLLHAFPLNARMWDAQVEALSDRYRVIAPDFPGFGGSAGVRGPATMERLAGDALGVLARLGVERASVVGLSMGGYAAFEVLRQRPDVVRALALCDTRAGADTPEGAQGRETFAARALERGLGWVAEELLPKLLGPRAGADAVAQARARIAEGTPEGVAAAQRGMALRPDSTPLLRTIEVPTLVLVGTEDVLTPPAEARRMAAAVRGARLVELPGVGHLSNFEAPAAFDAALLSFLDGLPD